MNYVKKKTKTKSKKTPANPTPKSMIFPLEPYLLVYPPTSLPGVAVANVPMLCGSWTCISVKVKKGIGTSDEFLRGFSPFYGALCCCCCRLLARITFPEFPRRLLSLARVAVEYSTVIFTAVPLGLKVCQCSCYNLLFLHPVISPIQGV